MKKIKIINIILFTAYLIFLLYLTLFKNYLGRSVGIYDINLIPFKNIIIIITDFINNEVSLRFLIRNIFGNLIAFTPFAYFLITLFKIKDIKKFSIIMFLIILTIETLQLILKVGFFDIDDIILNMIGSITVFIFLTKNKRLNEIIVKSQKLC